MKQLKVASAVATLLLLETGTSLATTYSLHFINQSSSPARIAIYQQPANGASWKVASGALAPRCVQPGQAISGNLDGAKVEIRADVMSGADCTGTRVTELTSSPRVTQSSFAVFQPERAQLERSGDRFSIDWNK
jgi:hypothetical protein